MGDPLGGNTLTTKLMIENRQSSGEFVAGLASLSTGSRAADRRQTVTGQLQTFEGKP